MKHILLFIFLTASLFSFSQRRSSFGGHKSYRTHHINRYISHRNVRYRVRRTGKITYGKKMKSGNRASTHQFGSISAGPSRKMGGFGTRKFGGNNASLSNRGAHLGQTRTGVGSH